MIIKSISRKSNVGQLIRYIFKEQSEKQIVKGGKEQPPYVPGVKFTQKDLHHLKAEKEDAQFLLELKKSGLSEKEFIEQYIAKHQAPFVIKSNIRSKSINGYIREFEKNEAQRLYKRSDQVAAYHTILSWSPKDAEKMNDKMLRDIGNEYIRLRGNTNLFIGTVHREKDHLHLHICVSGNQLSGKSSRVTKQKFQEIKEQLQNYQRLHFPELTHSLPRHGRSKDKELDNEAEKNVKRNERTTIKNDLQCLETISAASKSTDHFISQLNEKGYSVYYRSGKLTGIEHEGYKFRFSRLTVDMDRLKKMDIEQAKQEQNLKEIQALRQKDTKELGITKYEITLEKENSNSFQSDSEQASLKELSELRENTERENENDRADLDSEPDCENDTDEQNEDTDQDDQETGDSSPKENDTDDNDDQ